MRLDLAIRVLQLPVPKQRRILVAAVRRLSYGISVNVWLIAAIRHGVCTFRLGGIWIIFEFAITFQRLAGKLEETRFRPILNCSSWQTQSTAVR